MVLNMANIRTVHDNRMSTSLFLLKFFLLTKGCHNPHLPLNPQSKSKSCIMEKTMEQQKETAQIITSSQLLEHWQGHRRVTRRVIEAFPEKELFTHSIGGMRPFSEMVNELLGIAVPGLQEIVSGKTTELKEHFDHGNSKARVLEAWDKSTEEINSLWGKIKLERFQENIVLFGQYEGSVQSSIFYFIDNEIHHRGQAYVYLRSLGIEPPFFWERDK